MTLIQKELKWNFENEKNEWKVNTLFSHKVLQYSSSSSSTHVLLTGRRLQHICYNATMLTLYIYCIRRERHIEKYMTYSQKYWLYFIYESVNTVNTTLTVLHIFRKIKSTIKLCQLSIVLIVVITHSKCDELFVDGRRNSVGCRYF